MFKEYIESIVKAMIEDVQNDVIEIRDFILEREIKDALDGYVKKADFQRIETIVEDIERNVPDDTGMKLYDLEQDCSDALDKIKDLESQITDLESRIMDLESEVSDLKPKKNFKIPEPIE